MLQSLTQQILIVHYNFSILLQVCQYGAHIDGTTPHPYSCGTNNGAMLVMSSFSPLKFTITYTGGEGNR